MFHSCNLRELISPFFTGLVEERPLVGRPPPMRVNVSDVAAVGAHTLPITEGSRIRQVPSSDREKDLREAGRNAWTAAAPCARGTTSRRFQPPDPSR